MFKIIGVFLLGTALAVPALLGSPAISLALLAVAFSIVVAERAACRAVASALWSLAGVGLFVAAVLSTIATAFADDGGSAAAAVIDFKPIADMVITGLAGLVLALGSYGIHRLTAWINAKTGIELDAATRGYLEAALHRAVEYGQIKAQEAAAAHGAAVDVKNVAVAAAVNYAVEKVPDALSHFGITEKALSTMVEARLGSWLGGAAAPTAEPATPAKPNA